MQLALREMPALGHGPLLAGKNRSLASRTSGGLSGDILKTMPFEPNATPVFQIKREMGSLGRRSAACRAHVTHSRVAHASFSLSLDFSREREKDVKVIALCYGRPPDLRPLRYYYCDVSGSNWFDLYQLS